MTPKNTPIQEQSGGVGFEALLDYLKHTRGFDFSGYKPASLMRRFQKRMQALAIETFGDYLDFLEVHPEEFPLLFNTLLINVSSFFRDATVWEYIRSDIVPQIIINREPDHPIRVWSAGCATGEEPYTIAMVLAEALGADKFRERVKIYATDIDNEALDYARQANYSQREIAGIPPELCAKYFDKIGPRFSFRKDLRRSVIFGRNDLLQDAPISRVDLLICRNALMYFNAEAQAKIRSRFHFALMNDGYLFLGKAEMLLANSNVFAAVDLKRRIFSKSAKTNRRDLYLTPAQQDDEDAMSNQSEHSRFREAAFEASPTPQIVVDVNGLVVLVNEQARSFFNLVLQDIGRVFQDLELSHRIMALRARMDDAYRDRRPVTIKDMQWTTSSGELRTLEVQIVVMSDADGNSLGASLSFSDMTRYNKLQTELEQVGQELETAYEELQSTNEELETTNEELQSTVEELETTNEELHSTNEELETMNEELQSTNEEQQTINDELRRRTDEINLSNGFLESILSSLRVGVVVLDRNLQVQIWSHRAADLWGLRADEAQNRNFLNLDIGLPVEALKQPIRMSLAQENVQEEIVLAATNRRGKRIQCRVTCATLKSVDQAVRGVILLMEEVEETPQQETTAAD